MNQRLILAMILGLLPGMLWAHASEQGFVLLLPTDVYIGAGVASVALTVVLLAVLPAWVAARLFAPLAVVAVRGLPLRHATSLMATLFLAFLVWRGVSGSNDPSVNPLPLFVWTVFWIGLVSLQGVLGNHWRWTNPWTGLVALLGWVTGSRAPIRYPRVLGHAPGVVIFLCFAGFLLADPAPADPDRLALAVGGYWYLTLMGVTLFGPRWMLRAEALTILMRAYGRMGLLGRARGRLAVGLWGWQVLARPRPGFGLAVFILLMLGSGSFDGLNETFWWFGFLGINPLEFPGRSVVITQNLLGLIVANAALITAFAACLWLGERIAGTRRPLGEVFCLYAPTILPIALGYHVAHYLTSFMVDGQYVIKFLTDPMGQGADLLNLGTFYVTTGFFNTPGTVKVIFLTQAGAVVVGHVIAILLAHALAVRGHGNNWRAVLGQAPLALFMIAYTFFGLWLLASPRGV
ncbi:hypothetical protein [uncultured Roseovarius sp.]|uniref:hypothetical protein n=1 Tax=uncultured Roseovarius sp. TaxID=293344 RepID=UPI0025D40BE8|nr:hypothetical protein [uncultured Roseovarius sp.]